MTDRLSEIEARPKVFTAGDCDMMTMSTKEYAPPPEGQVLEVIESLSILDADKHPRTIELQASVAAGMLEALLCERRYLRSLAMSLASELSAVNALLPQDKFGTDRIRAALSDPRLAKIRGK